MAAAAYCHVFPSSRHRETIRETAKIGPPPARPRRRAPPPAWFRGIAPAHLARACSGADFCLFQHRRHHPAAAEATQLLRAANSAAWCVAMPTPTPRTPSPRSTRAGSRHWQPGGLLKKRLDTSAKAMEYKPQKPDPALAGAQARCSWSSTPVLATPPRATRRLGSEGHPRPQAAAPTHHRRRLSKPGSLLWLQGFDPRWLPAFARSSSTATRSR